MGEGSVDTSSAELVDHIPVSITVAYGGNCTVNMEISNAYNTYNHSFPEWFNRDLFLSLILPPRF